MASKCDATTWHGLVPNLRRLQYSNRVNYSFNSISTLQTSWNCGNLANALTWSIYWPLVHHYDCHFGSSFEATSWLNNSDYKWDADQTNRVNIISIISHSNSLRASETISLSNWLSTILISFIHSHMFSILSLSFFQNIFFHDNLSDVNTPYNTLLSVSHYYLGWTDERQSAPLISFSYSCISYVNHW